MSGGENLESWIKDEVQVNITIHSFEKDFQNGYYLGQILHQYGLIPEFEDKFVNRHQAIYVKTNFRHLAPVLNSIGIDFNSDLVNSIVKGDIGVSKKLLYKLKSTLNSNFEDGLKNSNKTMKTAAELSLHRKLKNRGVGRGVEIVEKKLVNFEEEFLRQKELANSRRQLEEDRYRNAIQKHRKERMDNLKHNHDYMKEWDKKHYGLWKQTRLEQKEIRDRTKNFTMKMTTQLKGAENRRLEKDRADAMKGIKDFEDNANRLGVQLEHGNEAGKDPFASKKKKKEFNPIITMQKINNKVEKFERTRKEKESRLRKIKIQQKEAEKELEKETEEKMNLQRFVELSRSTLGREFQEIVEKQRSEFINKNRREYYEAKDKARMETIGEGIKSLKTMTDAEYKQLRKDVLFKKRKFMLEERTRKYKKHSRICEDILNYMLEMTEECAKFLKVDERNRQLGSRISQQRSAGGLGGMNAGGRDSMMVSRAGFASAQSRIVNQNLIQLPDQFFRALEKKFVDFSPLVQKNELIFEEDDKKSKLEKKMILNEAAKIIMSKYLTGAGSFEQPMTYSYFIKGPEDDLGNEHKNLIFSRIVTEVIDLAFPMRPKKRLPVNLPHHLALKILVTGPAKVGKRTFSKALCKEFGLVLIDMDERINKAVELAEIKRKQDLLMKEKAEQESEQDLQANSAKNSKKKLPKVRGGRGKKNQEPEIRDFTEDELKYIQIGQDILYFYETIPEAEDDEAQNAELNNANGDALNPENRNKNQLGGGASRDPKNAGKITKKSLRATAGSGTQRSWKNNTKSRNTKKNSITHSGEGSFDDSSYEKPDVPKEIKLKLLKLELSSEFKGFITLSELNTKYMEKKTEADAKAKVLEEQRLAKEQAEAESQRTTGGVSKGGGSQRKRKESARGGKRGKRGKVEKNVKKEEETEKPLLSDIEYPFINGFVILGFPSNIEEARYVDRELSSFVPKVERLNKKAERRREKARHIMEIPERSEERDAFPSFDLILDLDLDFENLIERLQATKYDPLSEVYFNPQINPMPENDKKLRERVEDLVFDAEAIQQSYQQHQEFTQGMDEWYKQFGWRVPTQETPMAGLNTEITEASIMDSIEVEQPLARLDVSGLPRKAIETLIPKIQKILKAKYEVLENHEKYNEYYYEKPQIESHDDGTESKLSFTNMSSRNDIDSKMRYSRGSYKRRHSSMNYSKRMDSKSVMTTLEARQAKLLKKCSENFKALAIHYIDRLLKAMRSVKEKMNQTKLFLYEMQKIFVSMMQRDEENEHRFNRFIDNFKSFIHDHPDVYAKPYTKEKLIGKVDQLQDFMWEQIETKRDKALSEKEKLIGIQKVENDVSDFVSSYFTVLGCELNKLYYMKDLLVCYYAYKANKSEHEYHFDVDKIDFVNLVLPEINHSRLIPVERMEFIEATTLDYFRDFEQQLKVNEHRLPEEFLSCFNQELKLSKMRVKNIRNYICHKIKISKARHTNFFHRVEDWIVQTIKKESEIMYAFSKEIKTSIRESQLTTNYTLKDYDPAKANRIINFKEGPRGFKIPEIEPGGDNYFSYTQLYVLFTDLKNALKVYYKDPQNEDSGFIYHSVELEELIVKLLFRMKNIEVGYVRYAPEYWANIFTSRLSLEAFLEQFVAYSEHFAQDVKARRLQRRNMMEMEKAADELQFEDEHPILEGDEDEEEGDADPNTPENGQNGDKDDSEKNGKGVIGGGQKTPVETVNKNIEEMQSPITPNNEVVEKDNPDEVVVEDAAQQPGQDDYYEDEALTGASIVEDDHELDFTIEIDEVEDTDVEFEDGVRFIRFEVFATAFTLLRYPLPTTHLLREYESEFGGRERVSFEEFLKTPCWMDQYDEKQVKDLTPESFYRTIYTKRYLHWIFSDSHRRLRVKDYLGVLRCFVNDIGIIPGQHNKKTFFDLLSTS